MAIALVAGQFDGPDAGASPLTMTYASAPTAGNLLVAIATGASDGGSYTNGSIPGWSLGTWVQTGSTAHLGLWYKVAGASETSNVVLTWTGATGANMCIAEYGGFTGTPTIDKVADVDTTGGAVTSRSSGTTAETTAAAELCLAGWGMGNTTTGTATLTNSFTFLTGTTGLIQYMAERVVSSTGAYETTISWTTARVCGGLIATFKGVSASTWTPKVIIIS